MFRFRTTEISGNLGWFVTLDGVTVPFVGESVMFTWRERMTPGIRAPKFVKDCLAPSATQK